MLWFICSRADQELTEDPSGRVGCAGGATQLFPLDGCSGWTRKSLPRSKFEITWILSFTLGAWWERDSRRGAELGTNSQQLIMTGCDDSLLYFLKKRETICMSEKQAL